MSLLSDLLYRTPVVDRTTLLVSRPWSQWFAALLTRTGGSGEAPTNTDLAALVAGVLSPAALLLRVAALEAVVYGHLGLPTVQAVAAGAGAGATASVTGTDRAGTVTLTTVARQPRRSHSAVLQLTFQTPYAVAPVVLLSPANDAAWALLCGRFVAAGHAASVRLRQADVTTTGFPLRVGVTSFPREGDSYQWTFVVIG